MASEVRSSSVEGIVASTSGGFKNRPIASKIAAHWMMTRLDKSGGASLVSSEPNVHARLISAALSRC